MADKGMERFSSHAAFPCPVLSTMNADELASYGGVLNGEPQSGSPLCTRVKNTRTIEAQSCNLKGFCSAARRKVVCISMLNSGY